jgi:predicted nucleic acid-binding Zn ribbon protein
MNINLPNNIKKYIQYYIPHKKCIYCKKIILSYDKIIFCCYECYFMFNINKQIILLNKKIIFMLCIYIWFYVLYINPISFCIFWLPCLSSYIFFMYLFVKSQ